MIATASEPPAEPTLEKKQLPARQSFQQALAHLRPRPKTPLREYLLRWGVTPEGRPWDEGLYPHLTAPGGPTDAYDDPAIQDIWLMFGTRLGKTFWGLSTLIYQADVDPCSMLFVAPVETVASRVVRSKLYPMLEHNLRMRRQLMPEHLRNRQRVDLRDCTIHVGWSGSPTTLADLSARIVLQIEIDKNDESASSEADPTKLADERAAEFFNRKRIHDSTPTIRGRSRIERGFLSGDARRFHVPCPHCGRRQRLRFGPPDEQNPGGLIWQKAPGGKSDPLVGWRTAFYECAHCAKPITDEHRPGMMRAGIWLPEGQEFDAQGNVTGEALRPGPVASFQLSKLYSLAGVSWGELARQWITTADHPREHQNTVNSLLAETWSEVHAETTEEEIVERLGGDWPRGTCPAGVLFLTMGVDKQQAHLVYEVWGWGLEERGYLVDYGTLPDLPALAARMAEPYAHVHGQTLGVKWVLIDANFETDEIFAFAKKHHRRERPVLPCRGTSGAGSPYSLARDKHSKHRHRRQTWIVSVNTHYWQSVVQRNLTHRRLGEPRAMAFCHEATADPDWLAQITNEAPEVTRTLAGETLIRWREVNPGAPNDFRDAWRYARVAAEMVTRGAWGSLATEAVVAPRKTPDDQPPAAKPKSKANAPKRMIRLPSWISQSTFPNRR